MSQFADELYDAEADHGKAGQEAILCPPTHDKLLAALPQVVHPSQPAVSQPAASNTDATVQFAHLPEHGADAAMSLVSRAVAAATRTPTTSLLDSATQAIVKDAIREH